MPAMRPRRAPLYHQILEVLWKRIAAGQYAVEGRLPTEETLMREFDVSRHTMRAAVQQLVADGLLERFPGRGSFVVRRPTPASHWSIEALEDLIGTSFVGRYQVLSAGFIRAASHPSSAALYGLGPDDRVFNVKAVRSSSTGPYAYSNVYLPSGIGERLPRRLFAKRPFLLLVEEFCGLSAVRARQVASAEAAGREPARRLMVRPGTPLLVLERTYYTRDGRPIELVEIQYRPDRFRHVANFWRRRELPYLAPLGHRDRKSAAGQR